MMTREQFRERLIDLFDASLTEFTAKVADLVSEATEVSEIRDNMKATATAYIRTARMEFANSLSEAEKEREAEAELRRLQNRKTAPPATPRKRRSRG